MGTPLGGWDMGGPYCGQGAGGHGAAQGQPGLRGCVLSDSKGGQSQLEGGKGLPSQRCPRCPHGAHLREGGTPVQRHGTGTGTGTGMRTLTLVTSPVSSGSAARAAAEASVAPVHCARTPAAPRRTLSLWVHSRASVSAGLAWGPPRLQTSPPATNPPARAGASGPGAAEAPRTTPTKMRVAASSASTPRQKRPLRSSWGDSGAGGHPTGNARSGGHREGATWGTLGMGYLRGGVPWQQDAPVFGYPRGWGTFVRGSLSTWVPQWGGPSVMGCPGDGVPQFLGYPRGWGTMGMGSLSTWVLQWRVLGGNGVPWMPQFLGTHGGGTPQSLDVLAMGPQRVTGMKVGAAATLRGTESPLCQGYGLGTDVTDLGSPHELGAAHPSPWQGGALGLGGLGPLAGSYLPDGHGAAVREGAQSTPRVGAPPAPRHCHPSPCHPQALPPPRRRAPLRC